MRAPPLTMPHVAALAALLVACNVEELSTGTGGVPPGEGGVCPDGVTVVLSDYLSTQIALGAPDGTPLSPAFLSSASRQASGLSFAFSGDVVVPSERPRSGRVVLIDRFGTNVLTWADPVTAQVTAQLGVGTDFDSNPQDYIEVDAERAYVSRLGHNGAPGRQPFDAGDDVLVIDTVAPAVIGRIALPFEDELPPRPGHFTRMGERVLVSLDRASIDFKRIGDAELVALDPATDTIAWRLRVAGLKNCGGAVLSPSGVELALACSGQLRRDGSVLDVTESGIVFFDASVEPPAELARLDAASLAGEGLQGDVVFATERVLLFKTQTAQGGARENRLLALDRESGGVSEVLTARPGAGRGIVFGSVVCSPGCSDLCLLADADRGVIQRLRVDPSGSVHPVESVTVERRVGLPPVALTYR